MDHTSSVCIIRTREEVKRAAKKRLYVAHTSTADRSCCNCIILLSTGGMDLTAASSQCEVLIFVIPDAMLGYVRCGQEIVN